MWPWLVVFAVVVMVEVADFDAGRRHPVAPTASKSLQASRRFTSAF
jgi:hypothetical protein